MSNRRRAVSYPAEKRLTVGRNRMRHALQVVGIAAETADAVHSEPCTCQGGWSEIYMKARAQSPPSPPECPGQSQLVCFV